MLFEALLRLSNEGLGEEALKASLNPQNLTFLIVRVFCEGFRGRSDLSDPTSVLGGLPGRADKAAAVAGADRIEGRIWPSLSTNSLERDALKGSQLDALEAA